MHSVFLCLLLGSLAEVYSQSDYPYINVGGILSNNTYVNISQVVTTSYYTLECLTNTTWSSSNSWIWYPPNSDHIGGRLSLTRTFGKVTLTCWNHTQCPSGIYRCDISVIYGHSERFSTVYVGVYSNGGGGIHFMAIKYTYTC